MKSYPSVASSRGSQFRAFKAHVFDKIDGSNLRFEWSPKRGWYKFGTRKRLFDETDEVFGPAVRLWKETFAEPLGNWAARDPSHDPQGRRRPRLNFGQPSTDRVPKTHARHGFHHRTDD